MSLLKFFLRPVAGAGSAQPANVPAWEEDPLRHPDVQRMSLREIADLPLGVETGFQAEVKPPLAKCA
ncbi:hypothetical protein [Rhizobium binae]|nr:hypothetical protein [Rhizobium binae]NKL46811.1 hypothetical protein [Rhizobium leguminosarum bv. viciae]MBX4925919.1 hypothetical protein [Rhizobium binae]MBX4937769.1 hypothetical protein [Rhizobium binae]MBX4943784.1 hypothetical protein [Rhizobium binae]MBX4950180.1 hypothetical protein [Rhizobium binae]